MSKLFDCPERASSATAPRAERVIVFARYPAAGKVKTRLIPALGAEGAARLQAALTRKTLDVARQFCAERSCDLEVRFTGDEAAGMHRLFGAEVRYSAQQGDGLGERLEQAVSAAILEGARRVVVIGTDCPELDPQGLFAAFEALTNVDVVLGPALDGGYYLVGTNADRPELFRGIDWGSDRVLRQTLDRARRAPSSVRQLQALSDVDHPEDLVACRRVPGSNFYEVLPAPRAGWLSIVIPTRNEERNIEQTLAALAGLSNVEVIVADGGSTDATVELARRSGVRVVPVNAGRGRQMNGGAALASGEVVLFLHADTKLPDRFPEEVWSTLDQGAVAGAFRLGIDDARAGLRWLEWGANLRSHYLQRPYGDQAMFVRSEPFFQVGGFPNWPLMEDYELCRRLRRMGPIRLASSAVRTSARRWLKHGVWRTTLVNQLCVAGFHLGISPARLAEFYGARRETESDDAP